MRLETKHLASYLPYKITCQITENNGTTTNAELHGIYVDGNCVFHNIVESEKGFKQIKPILFPLSDIDFEWAKSLDYPDEGHLERSLLSGHAPYSVFQEFLSEHFDVFGLIEKGLAININKI